MTMKKWFKRRLGKGKMPHSHLLTGLMADLKACKPLQCDREHF